MSKMIQPEDINKKELMDYYGYKGFFGLIRLYWFFLRDYILYMLAYHGPHPGLAIVFNKWRGVKIGKHVYIGPRVFIDGAYPHLVSIEDYVSIGMNTMINAHSNPTSSLELKQKYYPRYIAPTNIKKGAWIAPGCIILAGISIGENAVVGAGSVVTKDVEPYTVVAGNPVKLIKRLIDEK